MLTMANTLERFRIPDLTPEEWEERNRSAREWEEEQRAKKIQERINRSCIPDLYRNFDFTDERIKEWCEDPGFGLLIKGMPGRMKTGNACTALRVMAGKGSVLFSTFDDLKNDIKASYSNDETERSIIARYSSLGTLCIDDLGSSQMTDWSLPILFEVIKKREEKGRPTIVTTNYSGDYLLDWMTLEDDTKARAIISRMSRYRIVQLEGPDRRRA